MRGFWRRHNIAAAALGLAAFLTAAVVATDPAQFGYGAEGVAINVGMSMAVGFPTTWAVLVANLRLASWWRRRHPIPSEGYPGSEPGATEVSPFRWSGRAMQHVWAVVAFAGFLILLSLAVLYDQRPGTPLGNFTLAIAVLMLFMLLAATAFAFRKRSLLIDASGIHVERGMRSDLHVRWSEIKEIGVAKFPFSEWAAPFTLGELPKMILIRGQDGRLTGVLQPAGETPREVAPQVERAVRAHAAAHGVPVRDVTTRETMTWRRPKAPVASVPRAP